MLSVARWAWPAALAAGVFTVPGRPKLRADLRGTLFRKVQALSFGNLDRLETGG